MERGGNSASFQPLEKRMLGQGLSCLWVLTTDALCSLAWSYSSFFLEAPVFTHIASHLVHRGFYRLNCSSSPPLVFLKLNHPMSSATQQFGHWIVTWGPWWDTDLHGHHWSNCCLTVLSEEASPAYPWPFHPWVSQQYIFEYKNATEICPYVLVGNWKTYI
jgi:hypothetical protein